MIIEKDKFQAVLYNVKPGIAKRPIVEALTNFHFTGKEVVTFNDQILIRYPFETDFVGSVKADDFWKTIEGIKTDEIEITRKDNTLYIKAGKTRAGFALAGEGIIDDFLAVVGETENLPWKPITTELLNGMLLCMFSVSTDMTKGALNCVLVRGNKVISSDEVRISKYEAVDNTELDLLIPAQSILELVKFPVRHVHQGTSWAYFKTNDGVTFCARIMGGTFPDVESFLDIEGLTLTLPRELKGLVNSISYMSEGEIELDKTIQLKIEDNKILCKAEKSLGWIEKELDFEFQHEPISTLINPYFFSQILDKATTMTISETAALFISGNFRHIISLI
jgi:DNA polymerase III sliding clamp (beta) subunit (PCNA family)